MKYQLLMTGVFRQIISLTVLIVTATLAFGCAKSSQDGGQVGGGGFVKSSSEQEVKSALRFALKLVGESNFERNIIVQYWRVRGSNSPIEEVKNPLHVFPNATNGILLNETRFDSPSLKVISQKKIQLLADGSCRLGNGETNSDASVSEYNLNGEVCFSIGRLRRIPPNDLLRHILALALHEAVHLGGGGEQEARAWQDDFEKYFGFRFGDISKGAVETATKDGIAESKEFLQKALNIAEANPSDPQIYNFVGRFSERLSRLPDISDDVALEIKLKPQHPELIGNYVNAVLALLEKVRVKFEIPTQIIHAGPIPVPISFMSPALIKEALLDMQSNLHAIEGNFKAFLDDSMAPYSTCLLPEGGVDPGTLIPVEFTKGSFFPPRKCRTLEFKPVDVQTE